MALDVTIFSKWLDAYGRAWEQRDPKSAARLFTPDARYYWTPFEEPKRGRPGIAEAWRAATSRQKDIEFRYQVLGFSGQRGLAHWSCSLKRVPSLQRVRLDGILSAEMNDSGLCMEFREWWHSDEPRTGAPAE